MKKIDFTLSEIPLPGVCPGVFADVLEGSRNYKRGVPQGTLGLVTQLEKMRSDGQRFTVTKTYVLNSKGLKALRADTKTWRGGKELSQSEISTFDPEAEFLGKPCLVTVTHATENSKTVARMSSFLPASESTLTVSADFVRVNQRAIAAAKPATEAATENAGLTEQ